MIFSREKGVYFANEILKEFVVHRKLLFNGRQMHNGTELRLETPKFHTLWILRKALKCTKRTLHRDDLYELRNEIFMPAHAGFT